MLYGGGVLLMRRGITHTSIGRIAYEIMTRGGRTRRPDAGVEGSPYFVLGRVGEAGDVYRCTATGAVLFSFVGHGFLFLLHLQRGHVCDLLLLLSAVVI